MKYVILIYSNPASRSIWETFTPEQRAAGLGQYAELNEDLTASGELIVSEALADPTMGKRVALEQDQVMATDGPFAEAKEQLAGFFLVECESMERAIEHASRVPEARLGLVEVRPVMDLKGFEM
jgi:hypothetical protein